MIFGIAKIMHSDNSAAFRGKLVETMAAKIPVKITHVFPCHSQGNPFAERSIQRFQRVLRTYTSDTQTDTVVFVPVARYAMDTIPK